jgi:hypothetical protein
MHSSPLMLISALGLAFMSFEATAETWPTKTRSSHLSGQFYGRGPARRVRAAFEAARPEDHRREPAGRWDNHRGCFCRQVGFRRLHHPRELIRTYHSASPVSEAELQSSAGFCGGCAARHCLERSGGSPR